MQDDIAGAVYLSYSSLPVYRVASEKAQLIVVRCLFRVTKLRYSRLDL
jgi:hypothetical protein